MADYRFLTTWLLDAPREDVWEAIYAIERWPELAGANDARVDEPRRGEGPAGLLGARLLARS